MDKTMRHRPPPRDPEQTRRQLERSANIMRVLFGLGVGFVFALTSGLPISPGEIFILSFLTGLLSWRYGDRFWNWIIRRGR